ncbi:MAG TPA: DUF1080 domain-containing protein [Verrucomicrobiae bacterium]|jgi:hypothetical protein
MQTTILTSWARPALAAALALTALKLTAAAASGHAAETILFDGKDLAGWREPAGTWQVVGAVPLDKADNKHFAPTAGKGVLLNSATNNTVNLLSAAEHGDVEAHIEFVVPKSSNSGVYFQGRYEIQVFDSFGVKTPKYNDCGGVYGSCSGRAPEFPGRGPDLNASRPPGEWQSFDVVFRAPRFNDKGKKIENAKFIKVTHNGQVIHENVEVPRPTCAARSLDEKPLGPLMLQGDHGPVAYRNLRIKKVELK